MGLLNNWLFGVGELSRKHREQLNALPDRSHRIDALCELNVVEQVRNVCRSPILLEAWRRGQEVTVHAWIYDLTNGRLKDLEATVDGEGSAESILDAAIARPPLGLRSA
ncbi:MAG TPA: carbonic anhydrase [Reyranella sp.]